ncbi:hypothetical protein CY34DRAFT_813490 [Suillus luteus UH-Slu-Lm8-n1]|uniref:Unplaced genomic scaffold CY34scaffold_767, whole genome shotgun sequence n=1 Tax=Suillus luteus UH-Slu-Lm8-n1 TaxID=930992 RepID=A0A0D0ANR0_9AGAM|nr:hypothetical protein CY34DRAFT_813490 [Suillus luteus UH-Slu-Lm8-n1]
MPGRPSLPITSLMFNHLHNVKVARLSWAPNRADISQDVVISREGLHRLNLLVCSRGG